MFLKRRLGVLAAVVAALAVGAFVASAVGAFEASASAATMPGQWIVPSSCAVTNPATGCAPYWAVQGSPVSTDRSSEARFPFLSGRLAGSPSSVTIRGCGKSCRP
jgi:type 1 fimbria pilin